MPHVPLLAGQLATPDAVATSTVKLLMDWTPIDDIGNFATNFSAAPVAPRMRKLLELGTEVWEFEGRINCANGSVTASTVTMFTFDVGHRVGWEREFAAGASTSAHYPARLGFMASGTMTISIPSAAGTTTSVIWLDNLRITNPY
ncbi:hypothetical protein ACWGRF_02125 [Streptomyces zhihengii]